MFKRARSASPYMLEGVDDNTDNTSKYNLAIYKWNSTDSCIDTILANTEVIASSTDFVSADYNYIIDGKLYDTRYPGEPVFDDKIDWVKCKNKMALDSQGNFYQIENNADKSKASYYLKDNSGEVTDWLTHYPVSTTDYFKKSRNYILKGTKLYCCIGSGSYSAILPDVDFASIWGTNWTSYYSSGTSRSSFYYNYGITPTGEIYVFGDSLGQVSCDVSVMCCTGQSSYSTSKSDGHTNRYYRYYMALGENGECYKLFSGDTAKQIPNTTGTKFKSIYGSNAYSDHWRGGSYSKNYIYSVLLGEDGNLYYVNYSGANPTGIVKATCPLENIMLLGGSSGYTSCISGGHFYILYTSDYTSYVLKGTSVEVIGEPIRIVNMYNECFAVISKI